MLTGTPETECQLSAKIPIIIFHHRSVIASPSSVQFSSVAQASPSITNSLSLLKLMSIESVMPSNHLILCHPLLLPPLVLPSIRVFSNKSVLHIRWPKYWSFSPSNEYSGLFPLGWTGWISLQSKGLLRVSSNTTVKKHKFFRISFLSSLTLISIHDWKKP